LKQKTLAPLNQMKGGEEEGVKPTRTKASQPNQEEVRNLLRVRGYFQCVTF
jgi:hypothetical protein